MTDISITGFELWMIMMGKCFELIYVLWEDVTEYVYTITSILGFNLECDLLKLS